MLVTCGKKNGARLHSIVSATFPIAETLEVNNNENNEHLLSFWITHLRNNSNSSWFIKMNYKSSY